MLGGGLQLALIPAPLIAAAIIVFGARAAPCAAPPGSSPASAASRRIALLAVETAFLGGGGRIEASLGTPVAGIDYLLRLDLPGAVARARRSCRSACCCCSTAIVRRAR